jgi:acetoin utilization deacetylase AcuC-like enzyme
VQDYAWATRQIVQVAEECRSCGGRLVSVLEGGYDLSARTDGLAQAVRAHTKELMRPQPRLR